ncbi:MAG: hypothetical protein OXH05_12500 [Acidobacteria bacterium]|nr:hypothetical protein [Acidobacteriota bacterium]
MAEMIETEDAGWAKEFSAALQVAVSSAVARAWDKPELTMERFAEMTRAAERDVSQTKRIVGYSIGFRSEPEEAVRLICNRPEIVELFERGDGSDGFSLNALRSSFDCAGRREFVLALIARLVHSALLSGIPKTVRRFEALLEGSVARELPGLHATFVAGVGLKERWDIGEGLYAQPYDEYRQGELSSLARYLFDDMVREVRSGSSGRRVLPVAVLVQKFRWGPAISSRRAMPEIKYLANGGAPLDVASLVNLLAISVDGPLQVVGQCTRAARWFYELIDTTCDIGMEYFARSPVEGGPREVRELTAEGRVEFERLLKLWRGLAKSDRRRINLAISRLAGVLSRTGSLAGEDRVLDAAIALEILYGMTKRAKLCDRVGRFLGDTPRERSEIEGEVDRLYQWRVDIVHGLKPEDDRSRIAEAAAAGKRLARESLRKHLERGSMPTRAEWKQLET